MLILLAARTTRGIGRLSVVRGQAGVMIRWVFVERERCMVQGAASHLLDERLVHVALQYRV